MGPLGGAFLKAGVGLLGGILGKKKSPTPKSNILSQFAGAKEASEKYGVNFLTALGLGNPAGAMGGGGELSSGAFVAEALSGAVDTYFNETRSNEYLELARKEAAMEEARLQVARENPFQNFGYGLTSGYVPNEGGSNVVRAPMGVDLPADDVVHTPFAGKVFTAGGLPLSVSDNTRAQDWEDQYGDLVGAAAGYLSYMKDQGAAAGRTFDTYVNPWIAKGVGGVYRFYKTPALVPDNQNYFKARHAGPLAKFQ